MDWKEELNKLIPSLPTQMHTNNQTKLCMSMIYVVALTGTNNSFTLLCISLGLLCRGSSPLGNCGLLNAKIAVEHDTRG